VEIESMHVNHVNRVIRKYAINCFLEIALRLVPGIRVELTGRDSHRNQQSAAS
jgi:hypothetical protein